MHLSKIEWTIAWSFLLFPMGVDIGLSSAMAIRVGWFYVLSWILFVVATCGEVPSSFGVYWRKLE